MDFNLLFRILLRNTLRISLALLLLFIFGFSMYKSISLLSFTLFLFTGLECWYYQYNADLFQIKTGDENYLQTNFLEEFISSKEEQQIIHDIKNYPSDLGKVNFEDKVIRRFNFPFQSEYSASVSNIEKLSGDGGYYKYRISTKPLFPWIKYDFYFNCKHFDALREIVVDR